MRSMDLKLTKYLYEKDKHTIGCMFLFFSTFNGKNIFQLFFFNEKTILLVNNSKTFLLERQSNQFTILENLK
jgi:hypothetical protein